MELIIPEETPLLSMALERLRMMHVDESGNPIELRSGMRVALLPACAGEAVLFADRHPGGGVLVLGARCGLEAKGELRRLIAEQALDDRHVAAFGVRQWTLEERDYVRSRRVQVYSMMEISREGLGEMTDAVMSYVRSWLWFHVVLRIDAADPAFAPLDAPAGGLTARELLYVVQRLRLIRTLASVEVLCDGEPDARTAQLIAQVLAELA